MRPAILLAVLALVSVGGSGCDKPPPGPAPSASGSASASAAPADTTFGVPIGIPIDPEKVLTHVNPEHKAPYAGPKGTLKGTIRIDGDPPPDTKLKFPERCHESEAMYGKLFRVGLNKTLADAMVAVTQYGDRGFVPAAGEAVKVPLHNCLPSKRTYAVTFGQRIDVYNLDQKDSYMPYLKGEPSRTVMVATPQGAPVKLYPTGKSPSHYMIFDQLDSGLVADVFVLHYATFDVTGLDGQYEIKGIPVGKVRVDVFLPVIAKSDGQSIEIHEGDNTFDWTLHFDAAKDLPKGQPVASGAPAASAAPSTSAAASASAGPRKPKAP